MTEPLTAEVVAEDLKRALDGQASLERRAEEAERELATARAALRESAEAFHRLAARAGEGHKILGEGIHSRSLVKVGFDKCPEDPCVRARAVFPITARR